jgi:hypothetical protein
MQYVYIDSIVAAQISNGVIRLKLGITEPSDNNGASQKPADAQPLKVPNCELVMPVVGFTELVNACNRIGAELVAKGILKANDPQTPPLTS